ncbi:MAG: zinc ribbon domain-containing protein [Prolixibacteraceae bacterium]|nr:zinc ribbon domain-containing protein [Prolixibacteraceae bacterium]
MKKVQFAFIGAILGLPLSYYFQSDYVKSKVGGMGGYLKNFGDVVSNSDLVGNVILSVVIFALVGGVIGYFVDENDAKNTKMLNTSGSNQNAEKQTNFCPSCGGKIEDGETQFCESCGTKF